MHTHRYSYWNVSIAMLIYVYLHSCMHLYRSMHMCISMKIHVYMSVQMCM